jgi:hypothetical protein
VKPKPLGWTGGSLIIAKVKPNPFDTTGTAIIARLHPNPIGWTRVRVRRAAAH